MASPAEKTAEAINEMRTTGCGRPSQAPHVLIASKDMTAPRQVQKELMFTMMTMTYQEKWNTLRYTLFTKAGKCVIQLRKISLKKY